MIKNKIPLDKSLVGATGVFYVAAELSRRGWIAMPTIRNTKGVDVIISKEKRALNIQVKTNSYGQVKFPMSKENETPTNDLYYIFVVLKSTEERPDFYISESNFIAEYLEKTHRLWTTLDPKIKMKKYQIESKDEIKHRRENSTLRQFPNYLGNEVFPDFNIESIKDNWHILE